MGVGEEDREPKRDRESRTNHKDKMGWWGREVEWQIRMIDGYDKILHIEGRYSKTTATSTSTTNYDLYSGDS